MTTDNGQLTAIKESSDELNPPVMVADRVIVSPRRLRSAKDYLALVIATCGVGYLPLAPGTWGSLVALAVYFALRVAFFSYPTDKDPSIYVRGFLTAELVLISSLTLIGVWASSRAEKLWGVKDPGKVVVDEVAGQLIALLPVPLTRIGSWPVWLLVAFLLFRLFDIVKPYPARRLESLESGVGIMADDVVAGAYAAVVVSVLYWWIG